MYKNILVPMALDHGVGETSLEVARMLLADGGKITVLHVYETPQGSVGAYIDASVDQRPQWACGHRYGDQHEIRLHRAWVT